MREKPFFDPDRRWEGDERGTGVTDATWLVHGASELLEAMGRPDWVAEDPEGHLLPRLKSWCARPESPLRLLRTMTAQNGCFEVALEWEGEKADMAAVRSACFALAGTIAESATYLRQRLPAGSVDVDHGVIGQEVLFEAVTGMLGPDTAFASHGHSLRLRVHGAFG